MGKALFFIFKLAIDFAYFSWPIVTNALERVNLFLLSSIAFCVDEACESESEAFDAVDVASEAY